MSAGLLCMSYTNNALRWQIGLGGFFFFGFFFEVFVLLFISFCIGGCAASRHIPLDSLIWSWILEFDFNDCVSLSQVV